MLRSFSYVEHSALRAVAHDDVEVATRAARARLDLAYVPRICRPTMRRRAVRRFTMRSPGLRLVGPVRARKALYELRYEIATDLLGGHPLQGILDWA